MKKPNPNDPTPFDTAVYCAQFMSVEEKLGLMKLLSLSLGGPRLYTETEVKVIVQGALDEHQRRVSDLNAAAKILPFTGKTN